MSDTLSCPIPLRLDDTDAPLIPTSLGEADPFAARRGVAWSGETAMAAGRVAWEGGTLFMSAFPHTELLIVQGGALTVESGMETDAPVTLRLGVGQAAVLPRGAALRLRADAPVSWSFCAAVAPASAPALGAFALVVDPQPVLSPSAAPAAELLLGPVPACRSANQAHDAATGLRVGVWDSTPYARRLIPHRVNELMHILEGEVTLTDASGAAHRVVAGDTVFVPRGAPCAWTSAIHVRKIYAVQDAPA